MLVPFLNGLAALLKRNPSIPDWQIPRWVVLSGALLMMGYSFAPGSTGFILDYALAGAMAGLSAIGMHQLFAQGAVGKKEHETAMLKKEDVKK